MAMAGRCPSFAADGTEVAAYAGFLPRLAASLIDWTLCFWIPAVVMGSIIAATYPAPGPGRGGPGGGAEFALAVAIVLFLVTAVVTYFLYFTAHGQSLGMKVVAIRIVNQKTGRPPGMARALARSFLALVVAASAFLLANFGFSDPPQNGYSSTDLTIVSVAAFLLLAGAFGYLWAIWDPKKQTLQDKVAGVLVVARSRSL